MLAGFVMLVPFYWVLKTSVSGENIYAYPPSIVPAKVHPFFYVDVWYAIPFARYFLNSVAVSAIAVAGNVVFKALAGYALAPRFPGKNPLPALFLSCMMLPSHPTPLPPHPL